jgi:hypothetical protein
MQTDAVQQAREDRQNYFKIRQGDRCQCGRHKWPGFSFCFACRGRLPRRLQAGLYGPFGDEYITAYREAYQHLTASCRNDSKEG